MSSGYGTRSIAHLQSDAGKAVDVNRCWPLAILSTSAGVDQLGSHPTRRSLILRGDTRLAEFLGLDNLGDAKVRETTDPIIVDENITLCHVYR